MHRGKFEQAHGGTLFLDEIGDMPLALQARLLRVPPLRERPEDVPWLAQRFIVAWNAAHPAAPRTLGTDAEQALMRRAWPGNVRELRNAIERACLLSESDRIETSLLREDTGSDDAPPAAPERASTESPMPRLEEFLRLQEREFIRQALQRHDFQIGVTADALGISRKSLWERMKRLAIG